MSVTKIHIEEKGKEINELNFTYFKISKGNTLSFTSKTDNNIYIIKLVSDNNGNVIINNNNYYFEEQMIQVIEISGVFTITSVDNNFIFAIKLKIPEDNIDYGEIGKNYILTKDKYYKFVIFPINAYDFGSFYFFTHTNNKNWSYEIGFKDLNEIEKRGEPCGVGDIDLYEYNKTEENKNCYLIFFFENITYYDITIETKYYKSLSIEEDEFIPINGTYMRFSYENEIEKTRYFFIPYSDFTIMRHERNSWNSKTSNFPISYEIKNDFGSLITIDTKNEIVYINFHKYKEDEKSHYYNIDCNDYFWLDDINENYIRFNFSNLFSDAPEISYTLVITPASYYRYLIPDYVFFKNFYINNATSEEDMLVYRFTLKDMIINEKDPSICSTNNSIELPSPDISFFRKEKTRYMFKLLGVTGPKYKDVSFYKHFYYDFSFCFNTC